MKDLEKIILEFEEEDSIKEIVLIGKDKSTLLITIDEPNTKNTKKRTKLFYITSSLFSTYLEIIMTSLPLYSFMLTVMASPSLRLRYLQNFVRGT